MTGELIRVIALLIITAVFALLLKSYRPEMSIILTLAAVSVVLFVLLSSVSPIFSQLESLFERSGVDTGYFTVVLKALGLAYITGFIADTCRDFGFTSLAAKAELGGRCAILTLSLPLLTEVLSTALELAGV